MHNIIEIEHLSKRFGAVEAVQDLSFHVKEGELFAFLGVNGAGKSTTINILCGQLAKDAGTVRIGGVDLDTDADTIKRSLGVVFQNSVLDQAMTVQDNLESRAALYGITGSAFKTRLAELAALLDFEDLRKRPVGKLSGGQRRRIDIARALLHAPKLLILDEPTTGLDPLMQREFFDILQERNRAGATIFLSSHILSEIQRHCTRAAIIREGRIIACDSVEALSRTSAKRISLRGSADLSGLDGVRDLQSSADGASFLYSGDIRALLSALARSSIQDLSVSDPDLEEIFLHYYENGGDPA